MMGNGRPKLSLALACALVMYPVIGSRSALGAEKAPAGLTVKAGQVTGILLNSIGKPAAKVAVKALGSDGKVAASTVTDKDGVFVLKKVAVGEYTLAIGKQRPLPMKASARAGLSHLLIVIPSKAHYSAGAWSTAVWTWVIVGGVVVATGVTLPLALGGSSSSGDDAPPAATPTPSRRRVSP